MCLWQNWVVSRVNFSVFSIYHVMVCVAVCACVCTNNHVSYRPTCLIHNAVCANGIFDIVIIINRKLKIVVSCYYTRTCLRVYECEREGEWCHCWCWWGSLTLELKNAYLKSLNNQSLIPIIPSLRLLVILHSSDFCFCTTNRLMLSLCSSIAYFSYFLAIVVIPALIVAAKLQWSLKKAVLKLRTIGLYLIYPHST